MYNRNSKLTTTTSRSRSSKGHLIYMGKDKFENEKLIEYSWPEDVWFHVDDLSSAHVYLRYPKPGSKHKPTPITEIPKDLVEECSQLVKANSIEGCKLSSVNVVYTPTDKLRKTNSMVTGQVGFHDSKLVIKYRVEKRNRIRSRRFGMVNLSKYNIWYCICRAPAFLWVFCIWIGYDSKRNAYFT